jgi:hypothetical protein
MTRSIFRQPLHVSGESIPIIRRYNRMYTTVSTYYSFRKDIHLKRIISTNCCIHTVVPPHDGHRYARNMSRLTKYTKNKLCKLLWLNYEHLHLMPPDFWNFQIIIVNNFNLGSVKTMILVISTDAISYKHTYITSLISLFSSNGCTVDTWQLNDTELSVKLYACPASYVEGRGFNDRLSW